MRNVKWCVLGAVLALTCMVGTQAPAQEKAAKLRALIVTGFDVGAHKWRESTQQATAILEKSGRFEVKVSEDVEVFASPSLDSYDVVVLNYGFWKQPEPSEKAKAGLLDYVKSGKGLVALHFACSSFQDWAEYRELLGRVWKKGVGGHGPYGKFTVKIKEADHPIVRGLTDFETEDELYAKLSGDAKIDIIATAYSEWSKKVEPIVFSKSFGKGRVVQNVLGHSSSARENAAYQAVLRRAVEWAATGKVTVK